MVVFSPSILECIDNCKRLYFYRYVKKPDVKTNPHIALGMILHRMFDRYYKINFKTKESFLKQYAHEWNNVCIGESKYVKGIWFHNEEERSEILDNYFWIGWHTLSRFYHKHKEKRDELEELRKNLKQNIKQKVEGEYLRQESLDKVTKKQLEKETRSIIKRDYEIEKRKLFPKIEKSIDFQWECFDLTGKIDRIDKKDGEISITDYKTGKKEVGLYDNHQFTIYYLAVLNEFGKAPKDMIRSYIRLDKDIPVILGDEHFDYLKNDLEQATIFLREVYGALGVSRKRKKLEKKQEKKNMIVLPFEDPELEWANSVLDIKRFKPRREGQCYFCDYHIICSDQIKDREEELRKIHGIEELEDRIESFWDEIEFE